MIIVTPLLSLVTQQTQINSEIDVSYVVALHVWMMACTFIVFMALVELAFAVVYVHNLEDKKTKDKDSETGSIRTQLSVVDLSKCDEKSLKRRASSGEVLKKDLSHWIKNVLVGVYGPVDWSKAPLDRNKVDYCARVLFPCIFALFIFVYTMVLHNQIASLSLAESSPSS